MGKSIYIISNHQLDWNIDIKDELKRRFDKNWSSFLEEEISIEDNNNKSKEIFVATNLNRIEFEFTKFGYISLASNRDLGEVKIYKNVVVYESPYVGKYDFIFPLVLSKKWQSEINIAEEDYVQAKAEIEDVLKDIEYVSKLIGGGRLMFLNEKSYDELLDEIINGARFKTLEVKLSRMKKPSFSLKDYLDWIENQKADTPPGFFMNKSGRLQINRLNRFQL